MNVIYSDECWICNGEYEYIENTKYEELDLYYFKCKKCNEEILVPKENPVLEFIVEGDDE